MVGCSEDVGVCVSDDSFFKWNSEMFDVNSQSISRAEVCEVLILERCKHWKSAWSNLNLQDGETLKWTETRYLMTLES